jgi:hypothetical protein
MMGPMSMNESQYHVVARVEDCDAEIFENIGATLSRTFRLDPVEVANGLGGDGVVVCAASSYEEARVYAKRVRDMGADSLVVDPTGKVVEQTGSPQKRDRPPSREEPALGRTMMGGFKAPGAKDDVEINFAQPEPEPESPIPVRVALPSEELPPLDGVALSLEGDSKAGVPLPPLDDTPGTDLLDDTAPSLPPNAAVEGQQSPAMFGALDKLDADNLVLLDGSTEEREDATPMSMELAAAAGPAPSAPAAPAAPEQPAPSAPEKPADAPMFGGADVDQFAPPDAEDEALELDTDYEAPGEGVGQDAQVKAETEAEAADDEEDKKPAPQPREEAEWIPAEDEERGPQLASLKSKPPPPPPSDTAPIARRSSGELRKPGWRAAVARSRSPLDLPVELFRYYPRLRIIVGFALALGLGAIAPTCYAGSVVDEKIQPLLVDLSTAKAHGHLMVGTPGYRSPDQIEESIGGIKTRHCTYAVLMWLAVSGVIGFLWFRFIRPD